MTLAATSRAVIIIYPFYFLPSSIFLKVGLVFVCFRGRMMSKKITTHPELPPGPPLVRLAPVVFFFFPPITSSVPHVSDELGSNISIPEEI